MRPEKENDVLWRSFKEGDKDSFQKIYYNHFNHLFEYGMRLSSGNRELVQDAIHDLFVKLWAGKSTLGKVSAVRSYLLVALRHTLFQGLEKSNRIRLYDEVEQMPFEMEFSVESLFINKETSAVRARQLIDALNQLSPRQKEAIYLRYYEAMDYERIAALLNITLKGAYKLVARGIEALRQILNFSPMLLLLSLVNA